MSKPYVKVTYDNSDKFNKAMKSFAGDALLVGVPAADTSRKSVEGKDQITNAQLLAIHEYGAPAANIPARPVLSIGLRNAQDRIAEELKKAAQFFFSDPKSTIHLERAGSIAANSVKKAINDQDSIAPPSEATLKGREARGFKGTKSLIVTGQMRNSITYVLTGLWDNLNALKRKAR